MPPASEEPSAAPAPAQVTEAAQERPINPKLKGIGGWLLFFCISVTILSPLAVFTIMLRSLASVAAFNLDSAAIIVISLLGIGTGISVWTISPRAIALVRLYLSALGGFALFSASLLIGAGIEDGEGMTLVANVRSLIFVGLWAAYFLKSERVRATFGRNLW